jgi:hypothetical protein
MVCSLACTVLLLDMDLFSYRTFVSMAYLLVVANNLGLGRLVLYIRPVKISKGTSYAQSCVDLGCFLYVISNLKVQRPPEMRCLLI